MLLTSSFSPLGLYLKVHVNTSQTNLCEVVATADLMRKYCVKEAGCAYEERAHRGRKLQSELMFFFTLPPMLSLADIHTPSAQRLQPQNIPNTEN